MRAGVQQHEFREMSAIRGTHPRLWSESLDLDPVTWLPLSCTLPPRGLRQSRFAVKSVKSEGCVWSVLSLNRNESWSSKALRGIKLFSRALNALLEGHAWARCCRTSLPPPALEGGRLFPRCSAEVEAVVPAAGRVERINGLIAPPEPPEQASPRWIF